VFPEATASRTTAALILDIDPVKLVRGKDRASAFDAYVNDRPYVASSFVSVALNECFGTAMSGRSKERPELAETPIDLEIGVPVLPARGGESVIRRLFEPLGYRVSVDPLPLDPEFPEWGQSSYYAVKLEHTIRLRDALRHLYVFLPALDGRKHYYMDSGEVDKIIRKGEGWLASHPHRDAIVRAYFGIKKSLVREALAQLAHEEVALAEGEATSEGLAAEPADAPVRLHSLRHDRVVEWIREHKPRSVIDLGCGEGKLLRKLVPIQGIERITGLEVSYYELERAERKMRLDDAGVRLRERVKLLHGSLMYRDSRLEGYDVATVVEVIEHLDPPRLNAFERVVFGFARPQNVLLTTPNREYNTLYGDIGLRHTDHRFEWTRAEFRSWAEGVASTYGYSVVFEGIGDPDDELGAPSQMAVFSR